MSFGLYVRKKVEKSKIDVQAYLNGTNDQPPRRQPSRMPNLMRATTQVPDFTVPSLPTDANKEPKASELEGKSITIVNEKISNESGILLRFSKEQSKIEFFWAKNEKKYKGEAQRCTMTNRVWIDYRNNAIVFYFSQLYVRKLQNRSNGSWPHVKELKNQEVIIWLKNKEQIKFFTESPFAEGLIDRQNIKPDQLRTISNQSPPKKSTVIEEEDPDDPSAVRFKEPTSKQLAETEKFRRKVQKMKEDEKMTILFDIFKIKKHYENPKSGQRFECPDQTCVKSYREVGQLKNHLKAKHPELEKNGICMSQDGKFDFSQEALDKALFLGKLFPEEMKKVIKMTKTKPAQ